MDNEGDESNMDEPIEDASGGGEPATAAPDLTPADDQDELLAKIARDVSMTKFLVGTLLAVVIVATAVLGVMVRQNDDDNVTKTAAPAATSSTTAPTASTEAPMESSAGKPCVATVGPLPNGSPPVDVVVGPPPTSLVIKDLKVGTGAEATGGDSVTINYTGVACSTGKVFDSSYTSGQPVTFEIKGVIPGFGQGVTGMKVGGQRLIGIPADQAYGATGNPPLIAPDESLWFVVELTAVTPGG